MKAGPQKPALRWLAAAVVLFHLVTIADQVLPDGDSKKVRLPTTRWVIDTLHLGQRWNMFRNPTRKGAYIRTLGLLADGREVELVPDGMPPEGPFFNLTYPRMVKLHSAMRLGRGSESLPVRYAETVCRMTEEPVTRVQVIRVELLRPTMKEQRGHPERTWEETPQLLAEVDCP